MVSRQELSRKGFLLPSGFSTARRGPCGGRGGASGAALLRRFCSRALRCSERCGSKSGPIVHEELMTQRADFLHGETSISVHGTWTGMRWCPTNTRCLQETLYNESLLFISRLLAWKS
jgi:hypothetical protein